LSAIETALSKLLLTSSDDNLLAVINKITNSQLECLIAIAESTNSKTAAERYGTHESSTIRSARELEAAVNTPLLRRVAAGVQLTDEGATFAMTVAHASREFDAALQTMFTNRETKIISIGAPVLDKLRLRSGSLDMILGVLKPHSKDLTSEVLFEDSYHVAGRVDHPLAKKRRASIADLSRYDWVVPNRNAPRRKRSKSFFANASKRPAANIETHSLTTITMTLASSNRLTLLTASELKAEGRQRVVAIPFSLGEACSQVGLTYLTTDTHTPHHETLVSLFRKHAQIAMDNSTLFKRASGS
jgi:DNA-binding transcriptional LysR family regulator